METEEALLRTLEEAKILAPGTYMVETIEQEWAARGIALVKTKRKTRFKSKEEPLLNIAWRKDAV